MINSWRQSGLVALVIIMMIAVGGGLQLWTLDSGGGIPAAETGTPGAPSPSPTATPPPDGNISVSARIPDCPVDRDICDFALEAEGWVRNGDAESLIADGSPRDNPNEIRLLKESIQAALPPQAWPVRVATIGCPILEGKADCSGAFSLTFTTMNPMEMPPPEVVTGSITLGFLRRTPMPWLTLIGGPHPNDHDDRVASTHGGRSTGCNLSGMPPRTETECILTQFALVTVERSATAGQPPDCPSLTAVCELALKVEKELQAGDFAAVASGVDAGAKLKGDLAAVLGESAPRLIAVACAFGNVQAFCTESFGLAFTTLDPNADWTTGGKLAVLQFNGPAESARFGAVLALNDADTREAAITGGFASKPCNMAGTAPDQVAGQCSGAYFERYWSKEPFVVANPPTAIKLSQKAPAPPPANSVVYTAAGPCWACDQPDDSMQKHVIDAAGKVTTTTILANGRGILDGWTIGYLTGAPDGSVLAAMVCDIQYCGAMGSEKPEATWRVVWSKDGGATWTEAFRVRTEYAMVESVSRNGFVVRTSRARAGGALQTVYAITAAGVREVQPPADLPARPDAALLADGSVVWIPLSEDGLVVGGLRGEDGRRLPISLPPGAQYPQLGSFRDGRTWAVWYQGGYRAGVFKPTGEVEAIYDVGNAFRPGLVNPVLGIGTVSVVGVDGGVPALIDFTARTITPMGAPFGGPSLPKRNRIVAFEQTP